MTMYDKTSYNYLVVWWKEKEKKKRQLGNIYWGDNTFKR